jgi:hypothetical protein
MTRWKPASWFIANIAAGFLVDKLVVINQLGGTTLTPASCWQIYRTSWGYKQTYNSGEPAGFEMF